MAQNPGKDFKWRLSDNLRGEQVSSYWYLMMHSMAKEDLGRAILKVQVISLDKP